MDNADFWSGVIAAFIGALIGGLFTLLGGWLQTDTTLRAQKRERLLSIYQPITGAADTIRSVVTVLTWAITTEGVAEKCTPETVQSQIQRAQQALPLAKTSTELLALERGPLVDNITVHFALIDAYFIQFQAELRAYWTDWTRKESLLDFKTKIDTEVEKLRQGIQIHLTYVEQPAHQRYRIQRRIKRSLRDQRTKLAAQQTGLHDKQNNL